MPIPLFIVREVIIPHLKKKLRAHIRKRITESVITASTQITVCPVRERLVAQDAREKPEKPLDDFYAWNPAVGTDCANLQPTYYVCVGKTSATSTTPPATSAATTPPTTPTATLPAPPGPTQEGIPANCNKWVAQKDGVYCYDMAQAAGISLDTLYALNPALKGDCSGLWPGYAYCIGTS